MAKGICWHSHQLRTERGEEPRWAHCQKPAGHLCEHYDPAKDERWLNYD